MGEENVRTEEYQVTGDDLVANVKELMPEGNIRRVNVQSEEGKEPLLRRRGGGKRAHRAPTLHINCGWCHFLGQFLGQPVPPIDRTCALH